MSSAAGEGSFHDEDMVDVLGDRSHVADQRDEASSGAVGGQGCEGFAEHAGVERAESFIKDERVDAAARTAGQLDDGKGEGETRLKSLAARQGAYVAGLGGV